VRTEGNGLPNPRLDVHDTCQVMAADAENRPPRFAWDGRAYSYVQSFERKREVRDDHATPGPRQRDSR
jgi:hypothetical protein